MGELIAALVALLVPRADRCEVLQALDVVRAAAWASGDDRRLEEVYAPGAGVPDVDRLRRWRERGIEVRGMRPVRSSCRPVGASDVEVVERLGPSVAVLADGTRRALPQDGWDRRVVRLEHVDGRWRIAAVR